MFVIGAVIVCSAFFLNVALGDFADAPLLANVWEMLTLVSQEKRS